MRDRDIDEAELRRLIAADDADSGDAADPHDVRALTGLLSAAAGADVGETGPLPGEEAALTAFRAAQPVAGTRRRLAWLRPGRRGRTATFAMAFAALLGSGAAVAAGATGHLTLPFPFRHPQPVQSASPTPSASVSVAASHPPASHTAPHSGGLPEAEPTTTTPPSLSPPATAKPSNPHHGPNHHGKGPTSHATGHHTAKGRTNGHSPTRKPKKPPNDDHPGLREPDPGCRRQLVRPSGDPLAASTREGDASCPGQAHEPHQPAPPQ